MKFLNYVISNTFYYRAFIVKLRYSSIVIWTNYCILIFHLNCSAADAIMQEYINNEANDFLIRADMNDFALG